MPLRAIHGDGWPEPVVILSVRPDELGPFVTLQAVGWRAQPPG